MAIKHAVTKVPGQKVFAVTDWNANHTGTLNHQTEITNVTSDQHHAQIHASSHEIGGGDLVDHNNLTNTHNLTTDIDHNTITNTHNLTTDIDHDTLTNFDANEHFLEGAIDHANLSHLAYADAGHTGFATSAQGALADTALQEESLFYYNEDVQAIENASPQYWILCRNAANNDVNGRLRIDRTSGNYQAASLDIVVTSTNAAVIGGSLVTNQYTQSSETYELVTLTLTADANSYVAIKYTGNTYPKTISRFTGHLRNSGSNTFLAVAAAGVSSVVSLATTNSKHTFTGVITATGGTSTEWNLGYDHSIDNSQAHTDYMLNHGDTATGNYDITGRVNVYTDSVGFGHYNTSENLKIWTELVSDNGLLIIRDAINAVKVYLSSYSDSYFTGGDVGIGTSTPATKLDVVGVITATGGTSTAWNAKSDLALGETSTTAYRGDRGKIAYDHSIDNSQAHTDYLLNTGDTASGDYNFDSNTLFIDASANNVGIGTTGPLSKLAVGGYGNAAYAICGWGSAKGVWGYGTDVGVFGSGVIGVEALGGTYGFYAEDADNINYFAGDVGIGDISPSYELDVTGRMRSTLGRVPAGSLHGATVTQNTIFDALAPSVPATNDEIIVTGGIFLAPYSRNVTRAVRYSSTVIKLYYASTPGIGEFSITNGDATEERISIAW